MKILTILLFIVVSPNLFASDESQIKVLMQDYLKALNQPTSEDLKKITSHKYFENLNKKGIIERTRELNRDKEKQELVFDIKIKKAAINKNLIFVNIKDIKTKNYGEYWYLVKKIDGKYIIDDMQFLD